MFQPYRSTAVQFGSFNTACLAGYWLRFDDFNSAAFAGTECYVPSKSEWVIEPHEAVEWKAHADILKDVNESLLRESAPMIWVKKADGVIEKVFVVWC